MHMIRHQNSGGGIPREYTPRELWDLGYQDIQVPIIPPDAVPGPNSGLAKMLASRKPGDPDPRGKMPGICDSAGRCKKRDDHIGSVLLRVDGEPLSEPRKKIVEQHRTVARGIY